MKKNLYFLSLLAVSLIILNGCHKEDDPRANGFTYKASFYSAETFGVYILPENNDYEISITISTGTWNFTTEQIDGFPFSYILLNTIPFADPDNLLGTGVYAYSASSFSPGIINGGPDSFYLNVDSSYQWEESSNVIGGNFKVSKDGELYVLDYTLSMENGETIEGYYKGALDYISQD